MICNRSSLAEGLHSSLVSSSLKLDEVGVTQSISSFELEIVNWITAFFGYSNLKGSTSVDTKDEPILDRAQDVLDILKEEVKNGILIPRVRNHLKMALVNLDVEFADSHDSDRKNCRVENCDGLKTCLVQLLDSRSPDTEWLVSWLKENVGSRDRQAMEDVLDSKSD